MLLSRPCSTLSWLLCRKAMQGCRVIKGRGHRHRGWEAHRMAQGGHARAGGCAGWPFGAWQQVLVRVQVLQGVL